MSIVKEMFTQFFHTYRQNWKKLLFFSVGITLVIHTLTGYAIPLFINSIKTIYPTTFILNYALILNNVISTITGLIFVALPVFFLLVNPNLGNSSLLYVFQETSPYRKPVLCLSIFYFIVELINSPEIRTLIHIPKAIIILAYILFSLCGLIFEGTIFFMIRDHSKFNSAFYNVVKTFVRHFLSVILLVLSSFIFLLAFISPFFLFIPDLQSGGYFMFFVKTTLSNLISPFISFAIYFSLNKYAISIEDVPDII